MNRKSVAILLSLIITISITTLAQTRYTTSKKIEGKEKKSSDRDSDELVKHFIGTTGIFKGAYGIFGLQFSKNVINENVYATVGVGRSLAGVKFGADVQHFSKPNRRGLGLGAGLAYVAGPTGSSNQYDASTGIGYTLTKRNALVVNTFLGGHFRLSKKSTFYIQTGYGIPTNKVYSISNFTGTSQDLNAFNLGLSLTTPHGFMTGIGFMFGF